MREFGILFCFVQVTFLCTHAQVRLCSNSTQIEKAVHESTVIFTGKIVELSSSPDFELASPRLLPPPTTAYYYVSNRRKRVISGSLTPWRAKVKVKTVFKGKKLSDWEREDLELIIGQNIHETCAVRRLRIHDTRVFFYSFKNLPNFESKVSPPLTTEWIENLSPLPPTLLVLTAVRQALKDEPCADKECGFGAECIVEGGLPVCKCLETCSSTHAYVCGSDGVTYLNECYLIQFGCTQQMVVNVKHHGECEKEDPCKSKVCDRGMRCVVYSPEVATCECIKCDTTSIELSHYAPVCGSDGNEYESQCALEFIGCETGKNIIVKHIGKCDPCSNMSCTVPSVCQLDDSRQPSCQCGFHCLPEYDPVCGSDGKTYNSECDMKREACRNLQDLRIIYRGSCASAVNPCESVKCRKGESCVINRFGVAECRCHFKCQAKVHLVCGSDGVTYDSECHLLSTACNDESDVRVAYAGSCELCEAVQCNFGARCEAGVCVCPQTCPPIHDPVCGTNSVTYGNECELKKFSCLFDRVIGINYYGQCLETFDNLDASNTTLEIFHAGQCPCHKLGSYQDSCDHWTGTCQCRPGVGGMHCDRCLPGYWGLSLVDIKGLEGCQACDCFELGSFRDDCEQSTGQCDCKTGVSGRKCNTCFPGEVLTQSGCVGNAGTERSISITTSVDYTEPGDEAGGDGEWEGGRRGTSAAVKSTRHLQQTASAHRPTPVTFQMRSYLGDSCFLSSECVTPNSACISGWCVCADGFVEDSESIQCKPSDLNLDEEESCSRVSCEPNSRCLDYRNGSYACACPLGQSSTGSETFGCRRAEQSLPFFDGESWIGLGQLGGSHKLSIEATLTPVSDLAHGILIFATEGQNYEKFVSLALNGGFVEFRYNLGSGSAILRSSLKLEKGLTYDIVAKRYNRDGLLRINDYEEIKGTSPGSMKSLKLTPGGFLGFVPINTSRVWQSVGVSTGFIGCIHKLSVGRRPVDFEEGSDSLLESFQGVHQCFPRGPFSLSVVEEPIALGVVHNPCLSSPCLNNGECWTEKVDGFKCVCHPQFSGKYCEDGPKRVREGTATLDFRGFSYMELPGILDGARIIQIEIWFWPRTRNGLLLYSGQEEGRGDFVALNLANGFLSFLFDLGSGSANITWNEPLELHRWHWVVAKREGRQGSLQVNGGFPVQGKSPPTLSELNLELPLYVGGVPDENLLVRMLGIPEPFDGALQHISVNKKLFRREIEDGLMEGRLQSYEGPPCGSSVSFPCHNGGSCFPRLNNFVCLCPPQFTGLNCQIRKTSAGPVRFNGKTFLKFPRKGIKRNKVQRRNEIEILFKTNTESPSVLLWIGKGEAPNGSKVKGRRGYLGLFLVEGYPELRVDLGPPKNKKPIVLRSKMYVADGRWHQILIVRRRRLLVFQVDGATPMRATSPVGSNVLVSDGQLWIGGIGGTVLPPEIPPSYHSGFRGCVDVLKMERRRLPLGKVALTKGLPACAKEDDD